MNHGRGLFRLLFLLVYVSTSVEKTFKYYDGPKSWEDARNECQSRGGNLATIHSQAENDAAHDSLCGSKRAYIGLHDRSVEGAFEWVDGSDFNFANWAPGEPNSYGGTEEDCVGFHVYGGEQWNDFSCSGYDGGDSIGYVCQDVSEVSGCTEVSSCEVESACDGRDNGCSNMGHGDGDCDSDADCATGLVCGTDNCGSFRDTSGWPREDSDYSWDTMDDCCYNPSCDSSPSTTVSSTLSDGATALVAIFSVMIALNIAYIAWDWSNRKVPYEEAASDGNLQES